ncbi:U-box domain-containing protein 73-like [Panicum miliaceum]|uniref:U-box domain-containing protein 73-like n=1 Tax=Panicum miliaceum TaxID=4540 RepID=A0A3L6QHH7_PANMI|nr:U-box domain-containing protein 73-like [Panicum miliaceum]
MSDGSSSPPASPDPQRSPRVPSSIEEKLLRAVERAIARNYAAKQAAKQAATANVSPWRRLFRKVIKEIKNGPATSKTASALPPALPRTQQEERERPKKGTDVPAGDSSSVSWHPSEAGAEGDGVQVVQAAVLDRPGYAEMMKSALARIQVGEAGGAEAFAEMEQALKGLMDVSFKAKDPVLPAEFKTKWTCANENWLQMDIIADPLILTSGHSVDRFSHQLSSTHPGERLLTIPNHLLRDVITAWCLDHAIPPPSAASTSVASEDAQPSEEEMQLLLENLSVQSVEQQQEGLRKIQLLSTFSKGVNPCLDQWQDLLPKLMGLHKKWKSTWTRDLEEKRVTIMLNLSLHRPNREILAKQKQFPETLMETIERARKLGYPLTVTSKVSSLVAILSEYNTFRRKVVEIGGIEMLGLLLCSKDALLRNEASAAILALCTDDATALSHVPNASLVECLSDGVVTDESLLLLERTLHRESVRDWIVSSVAVLMKVITKHGVGYVTSRGIQTAVGLIYHAVQEEEGRGRLETALILPDFVEVLRNLKTKEMPLERVFEIDSILMIAFALAD